MVTTRLASGCFWRALYSCMLTGRSLGRGRLGAGRGHPGQSSGAQADCRWLEQWASPPCGSGSVSSPSGPGLPTRWWRRGSVLRRWLEVKSMSKAAGRKCRRWKLWWPDSPLWRVTEGQPGRDTHVELGRSPAAAEGVFTHSSVDRHIHCFHVLETVSNAIINMEREIHLQDLHFILGGVYAQK